MGDAIYPVPAQWADSALIDSARYDEMYRSSVTDPDAFWRAEAQRLDWIKPFTSVKQTSFHEADFGIKWFADGSLNLAANALDRRGTFASPNGPPRYGLAPNADTTTLRREPWSVPAGYPYLGDDPVVTLRAGEQVAWKLVGGG